MNVHTWIRQTRFVNGILGVSLFLFGASSYGWAADEPATGELLAGRSQGAAPVLSRDITSEGESVWEDYAGMIAAATCLPSSPPEPERLDLPFEPISQKVRYVSFTAGDPGRLQAVRVVFANLPVPYDTWNGTVMWVQGPLTYCENAGAVMGYPCPDGVGGLPSTEFLGARLGCSPYFADWSTLDVVHVFDEGIIPGGVYHVQVVDSTCDPGSETSFSDPLAVTMSGWGDVVHDCSTTPCGPPDGSVGILDVTAILDKWKNLPGNVMKVRADIEGSPAGDHRLPDQSISITDVTYCLGAFLGDQYPGPGYPPPSPPPDCGGPVYVCGNWVVEPGEQCDDGNLIPGDGCDENCQSELCGNGEFDFAEECDDGVGNSDTEPDACRTDCTEARCGDNVIDTGEECDDGNTTPGDLCDENCLVEPFVGDVFVELRIMGNGPGGSLDPDVTLIDNEMTLPGGGHHIFLEIYISDWDPGMTGLTLKQFQFTIDSAGYSSGLTGALTPWRPPCTTDADCEALMGPVGTAMDGLKGGCNLPGLPPDQCAAAFAPSAHMTGAVNDFIFYMQSYMGSIDQSTRDYRYGATLMGSSMVSPHTGDLYVGTLVLDVPEGAAGTFTLDLKHGTVDTLLGDGVNQFIPFGGFEPAVIIVQTACCLPSGSCATSMSVEDCEADGGSPVSECAGTDLNGDGIDDACGDCSCCLGGGSCTVLSMLDCINEPGTPVCACLGDVDPDNGVDDACEPCAVANTALAEPMQCSGNGDCDEATGSCSVEGICECGDDDDCWNLASCINGVCYVPKNRYITFEPNNAGRCVALLVEMTSSDTFPGCTFTGTGKWVGEPDPATGISRVVDAPIYRNWTEPVIYVGDLEIVPASTYEVSAIEQACDPEDPSKYSAPLILPTVPKPTTCADSCVEPCPWADIVGIQVPPGVYLPPDGKVDFDDIVAMIEAILDDPNAPPITWTDLMREVPNGRIDIRDLIAIDDVCRSTDPYFTDYSGASPCGTGRIHQPPKADDLLRAEPTLECHFFDDGGSILVNEEATVGPALAIPSQRVRAEMFLSEVTGLRAYQVQVVIRGPSGDQVNIVPCPPEEDGVKIEVFHRVCAENHEEKCAADSSCMWCVDGENDGLPCVDILDCPGGTCEYGLTVCVGGDNHRGECNDVYDCPGGGQCLSCVYDFVLYNSESRHLVPVCDRLELAAYGESADILGSPPGYLGTYVLDIPEEAQGYTFEVDLVSLGQEQEEMTYFLTREQTANDNSISYRVDPDPPQIRILYDCNKNNVPDQCDIGDEQKCATPLCQLYTGPGRPTCGESDNCNNNAYPDECEIPVEAVNHAGEFFCPVDCICSATQEPCPEGCDCHTGDGCPVECEAECVPTAGCAQDCQPAGDPELEIPDPPGYGIPDECDIANCGGDPDLCDCNLNGFPDRCDIMEGDGFCVEEGGVVCSWDCQLNQVPDECEADCSNDGCPDDCEWMDRTVQGQSCGQPIAEEDCDSDGLCNIDEISVADNGTCAGVGCSSDCHFYCYDPGVSKPWCDPYYGIPDECDVADCPVGEPDCQDCDGNSVPDGCDINVDCASTCCEDCDGNSVPDICDLRDCVGDISCDDCNDDGVLDGCEIPVSLGGLCDEADPADCLNCDVNANGLPDRCECPGASASGACENAFSGPATDTPTLEAALRIELLDGTPQVYADLSGPSGIVRGTPHFHGDVLDTGVDEPCMVPYSFPEPVPGDFARSQEIHFTINSPGLGTCPDGPCLTLGAAPSLGEAQGMCLDFPGDSFVNLFIQFKTGPDISDPLLHTETPLVVRAELSDPEWGWGFAGAREIFVNDHSAPAIPLLDETGLHRGYLTRLQLGLGTFPQDSDPCEAARAIAGPVSFVVGPNTLGVLFIPPNHVDSDSALAAKKVRVYVSSGTPVPPAPDTTNIRDDVLVGYENPPDGFWSYDQITSVSFGTDGTLIPTRDDVAPILYFSVHGGSAGAACTDVARQVTLYGSTATDVYSSPSPHFGSYEVAPGALPPACGAMRGNCLVVDQTALGLGPHSSNGLVDDVLGLEMADFDAGAGDLAYLTFLEPSFGGDSATIWVYDCLGDPVTNPFEPGDNLRTYATAADLGLQAGDEIDALAVSDIGTGQPNGLWDEGDEVLISLAPGSPTLVEQGWSGAHIFRVRFEDIAPITAANIFLAPGDLGLNPGTDNIDAIDVGAGMVFPDCNENGIDDACDLARGFSEDVGENGVPDECETPCSVTCEPPDRELMPDPPFPPETVNVKVRYLSFIGSGPGQRQAIRVTFDDLPAPFDVYNGEAMWVGPPQTYCENAGQTIPPGEGCGDSPGLPPTMVASTLQCEPYYAEWQGLCSPCGAVCLGGLRHGEPCTDDSDCTETIHVSHSAIVPGGVYHLDAIDRWCMDIRNELSYSVPLSQTTSRWGDLVENCTVVPCGPPEGIVNVTTDVTALLDKWKNLPGCVMKARADIEGAGTGDGSAPDQLINITDVTLALDAFKGFAYPFEPSPPPPPCP